MNAPRILRKMTRFFHLQSENDCSKSNAQCSAQPWVIFFCSSRNCAENHTAHKSCGHSLFLPRLHHCHMLSTGRPFVFQGALGKALMPSKRKTRKKKEQAHFIEVGPLLKIKPMFIRQEGVLPYIKAQKMTLRLIEGEIPLVPVWRKGLATSKTSTILSLSLSHQNQLILKNYLLSPRQWFMS